MPWGTIRQHSTGATWENSSKAVNHSRIFGLLPTFKHRLPNNTISGTSHGDARRRTQTTMQPPRGRYSQPAVDVSRPQRARSRTMQHPPVLPVYSPVRPPRSMYDDPAFSADPQSHPHFVVKISGDRSRQRASRTASSKSSQSREADNFSRREYPISKAESGYSYDRSESSAYLAPTRGQPYPPSSSNHSLLTSESATTYASTTSSESYSSSGNSHTSNEYSIPVKQPTTAHVPFPVTRSNPSSKHSSRYEEPQPVVRRHSERPAETRNVSAPDLHQRSPAPPQAPRPMTAPLQDANNRPKPPRRENTRRHNPQRSGELDRIDELDETDPFGVVVHHKGPYEAITAILNGPTIPSNNDGSIGNGFNYPVQKQKPKKRVEPVISPEGPVFDPSAPLNLVPGQILPRAPIFDLRGLEQTPYQRQHRSYSNPPPPPGIASPPRDNDRQPPYPRYFPQESDLPPSLRHEPEEWREVQIEAYEDPYLTSPPPHPQPPPSRSHSRPQSQSHFQPPRQPASEVRAQTPPKAEPEYQAQPQDLPESNHPQMLSQPQSESLLLRPPSAVEPEPELYSRSQSHFESHLHSQSQSHSHHNQHPPQSQQRPIPQTRSQESESHRQPQPHRQTQFSNRLPSTSSISSRSSHYGPVPYHVPKHLVMPTPLQQSNVTQSHESASSHVHFYDHDSPPPKTNLQPRAKEISMVPDGRKLLRKRTVTHPGSAPIPVHVPLGEAPPSSISGKGLLNILGSRAQEPGSGPSTTKERGHRRLSKRRTDL